MPLAIKSRSKLAVWEEIRALDRIAIPLIAAYGVTEAYRLAEEQMEGRRPYGGRLEGFGESNSQDLASGQLEDSTGRAKC